MALDEVESAEVAGPGFLNLRLCGLVLPRRARGGRRGLRRRLGDRARAGAGRDGVGEPDRADRRLRRAQRRLRRLRRAAARVRRARGGARVLLQRRRRVRSTDSARRSTRCERGEPVPEDGYHGDYVVELAQRRGRSGAADARVDRGDDGALPHPLRQLGAAERARAAAARAAAAARHLRGRTARSGRDRPRTATSRTGC